MKKYLEKGLILGKWEIIKFSHYKNYRQYYLCKCKCGKTQLNEKRSLKSSKRNQCKECANKSKINTKYKCKHGLARKNNKHPLYTKWTDMKARCYNKNNFAYKGYGGRGITVCDEWKKDFKTFYNWCICHGYKKELTLDRENFNGNYEPSNCRFVNRHIQAQNTRQTKHSRDIIRSIKFLLLNKVLVKNIIKLYDVDKTTISHIKLNRVWSDVQIYEKFST